MTCVVPYHARPSRPKPVRGRSAGEAPATCPAPQSPLLHTLCYPTCRSPCPHLHPPRINPQAPHAPAISPIHSSHGRALAAACARCWPGCPRSWHRSCHRACGTRHSRTRAQWHGEGVRAAGVASAVQAVHALLVRSKPATLLAGANLKQLSKLARGWLPFAAATG